MASKKAAPAPVNAPAPPRTAASRTVAAATPPSDALDVANMPMRAATEARVNAPSSNPALDAALAPTRAAAEANAARTAPTRQVQRTQRDPNAAPKFKRVNGVFVAVDSNADDTATKNTTKRAAKRAATKRTARKKG